MHSLRRLALPTLVIMLIALIGSNHPIEAASYTFQKITSGFSYPTAVVTAPGDTQRFFVTELTGNIRIVRDGKIIAQPFLDLTQTVSTKIYGQGLFDLVFDPNYARNGFFYVDYISSSGDPVLARYSVSASNPDVANPASAKILLAISHPRGFHYGGQLTFGPDGYLYYSTGDSGSALDSDGSAQNMGSLLGALLRIDVEHPGLNGAGYSIPADNPFAADPTARPQLWAKGLRNPWRFSFDSLTGDLYIADVGESTYEEIDFEPAGDKGGENYGWNRYEGTNTIFGGSQIGLTFPVVEYTHINNNCAITGGYVYRGTTLPELIGSYIYADYCSGTVWRTSAIAGKWTTTQLVQSGLTITSFGQDSTGEIYAVDFKTKALYKLVTTGNS